MKFEHLGFLNLLWTLPFLIVFFLAAASRRRSALALLARAEILKKLLPADSSFKSFVRRALQLAAFALLILALCGPKWGYRWEEVRRRGIDLVLAVDVSKSMLAEDVKPSRLEAARRKISDLLDMLEGDRVALVAFAGTAFLQCPLTLDYGAAELFLDLLSPELIPVGGTNLAAAIQASSDAFDHSKSTAKAVILITDGEELEPGALQAAREAGKKGIRLYAIGIGVSEGAPIPLPGGGFKKNKEGTMIISRLNETLLRNIASAANGEFTRSTSGDLDLERIYRGEIKRSLEGEELSSGKKKLYVERYQIFALIAFLLLIVEALLPLRRGALRGLLRLVLVLPFLSFPAEALELDGSGPRATKLYEQGRQDEARKTFDESLLKRGQDPALHYNSGLNYYARKEYDKAREAFKAADQLSTGADLKARARFQEGNSLYHAGKLEEAAESYRSSLSAKPDYDPARKNLAFVQEEIKKRREEQKETQQRCEQKKRDDEKKQRDGKKESPKAGENNQTSEKSDENAARPAPQPSPQGSAVGSGAAGSGASSGERDEEGRETGNGNQPGASPIPVPKVFKSDRLSEEEARQWLRAIDENQARKKYQPRSNRGGERAPNDKDW